MTFPLVIFEPYVKDFMKLCSSLTYLDLTFIVEGFEALGPIFAFMNQSNVVPALRSLSHFAMLARI